MPLPPESVGEGVVLGLSVRPFIRPSVGSSGQTLLPRYVINALNDFDKTDGIFKSPCTDDLIKF